MLSGNGDGGIGSDVKCIHVPILTPEAIREVVLDRARQMGCALSEGAFTKVMDILATRGDNLSVMEEVLTATAQRAKCHGLVTEEDVVPPQPKGKLHADMHVVDLRVLEVLRGTGGKLPMGELVHELARSFSSAGERMPSPASVRRWVSRLQALGLVKRSVTLGGDGGTRSVVALTSPPSPHSE